MLMGRLGMVSGLPKGIKQACFRQFFTVVPQLDDLGS